MEYKYLYMVPEEEQKEKLRRVLIVDDESTIQEMIEEMLLMYATEFGVRIELVQADDPGQALFKLLEGEDNNFDLVISDVRMPGLTGTQIYQSVEKQKPELLKYFLFVTGFAGDIQIEMPWRALSILRKPFSYHEFKREVRRILAIA